MSRGKIVAIHSYRGGTGKSNVTANLAFSAASAGKRVAVLDTDIQSPGAHVLFGFKKENIQITLIDFLFQRCSIHETAYDLKTRFPECAGFWLVPASMKPTDITRVIDEGYDLERLNDHINELIEHLELDYLLVDTHPGLNRETLLATALSDVLVLILRPDQQDYYGTAVLTEVASRLEIPETFMVLNKVLTQMNREQLKEKVERRFGLDVIGMIPLSEDMAGLGSRDLFSRVYPNHEITHVLRGVLERWA